MFKKPSPQAKAKFFIGGMDERYNKSLQSEMEQFDDIVLVDFEESYRRTIIKVEAIFQYASKEKALFTIKLDDDVFLDLNRLRDVLKENIAKSTNLADFYCAGQLLIYTAPMRVGHPKWVVSQQEYPLHMYPPYMNGPCVIYTTSMMKYLLQHKVFTFPMEDVAVGYWIYGLLAQIKNGRLPFQLQWIDLSQQIQSEAPVFVHEALDQYDLEEARLSMACIWLGCCYS